MIARVLDHVPTWPYRREDARGGSALARTVPGFLARAGPPRRPGGAQAGRGRALPGEGEKEKGRRAPQAAGEEVENRE